jgi:putative endonuclease
VSDWLRDRARRKRWNPDQASGRRAEDLAHRHLRKSGYKVIARNWRTASGSGEIDIICRDRQDALVFVEVKSRETEEHGSPERQIDPEKRLRLLRAARDWTRRSDEEWDNVRFDVVSVVFQPFAITHHQDVFRIKS